MDPISASICCFLSVLVISSVTIFILNRKKARTRFTEFRTSWAGVAEGLGLKHEPGTEPNSDTITGTFRGHQVRVDLHFWRKHKRFGTRIQTFHNVSFPFVFAISQDTFADLLLDAISSLEGVKTGDEEFDDTFHLQSDSPTQALGILTPAVKEGLLEYAGRFNGGPLGIKTRNYAVSRGLTQGTFKPVGEYGVNQQSVMLVVYGYVNDGALLEAILEAQHELARRFDDAGDDTGVVYEPPTGDGT